jgi:TDG/mug DNA glycosylase family protein
MPPLYKKELILVIVNHTIPPVFDGRSRVLILGTIPSPKSREANFYYGHPKNRFWRLLGALFGEEIAEKTAEKKREFLLAHKIALWDVLSSCEIKGASDQSIKSPKPNNINLILNSAPVKKIFTTGQRAYFLYEKLCYPETGVSAVRLPSPSPANCGISFEEMLKEYRAIKSALTEDF